VDDVLELADRLWRGEASTSEHHPVLRAGGLAEVLPGVAFVPSFGNVTAFATGAGLVLVDTGSPFLARAVHAELRRWTGLPLHTAIYSHGHVDHVFGVPVFEEEAEGQGWPRPTVVAHEAVVQRFERYVLTAGYNAIVNRRQFEVADLEWPTSYRHPDRTYRDQLLLEVGGAQFELHHALGETDDHTWTFVPAERVLCCGDLFIWASPNAGNPQKVQRYPLEWAQALREMAAVGADVLLPGHGVPVVGPGRVRQALEDTASYLESLVEQVLERMNAGARLDEIVHEVAPPPALAGRPYLQPVYDEPEFVVRAIWRRFGGWYDGNPANLKPAPEARLAEEVAALAGGAARLAQRAGELAAAGELRLAGHLAELAALAAPGDPGVHARRAEVFAARAAAERSTMARGIFASAARESQERLDLSKGPRL